MKLIHLEEVDSTNAYAKLHMAEFDDQTVIYTSHQTSGRGRLSRKWLDIGAENIYMTICLKPFSEFKELYSNFTQYLSVILCMTLEDYGVRAKIKWPNDVLVDGRKIAGILSETSIQGSKFLGLALGVGINLNTSLEELSHIDKPATALSIILGKKINRDEFLHALLDKFCLLYNVFLSEGFLAIKDEYVKRASFINDTVQINVLGKVYSGRAIEITDNGALVLENKNEKSTYLIGDIL